MAFKGRDLAVEVSLSEIPPIPIGLDSLLTLVGSSPTTVTTNPHLFQFKPDGLTVFACRASDIREYPLTTAWDITSIQLIAAGTNIPETADIQGFYMRDDGLRFYIIDDTADLIREYSMSPAFDTTSLVATGTTFDISGQSTNGGGLWFSPDGTKMYIGSYSTAPTNMWEYTLSTAWDVSTASLTNTILATSTMRSIRFKPDGTEMYFHEYGTTLVHEYRLSTAWDLSTAVYISSTPFLTAVSQPTGFDIKPDGTKVYTLDSAGGGMDEFDMTVPWIFAPYAFVASLDVSGITGFGLEFSPDGSKMYILDLAGTDTVREYALGTAFDVTTAVATGNTLTAGFSNANSIHLSADGLRLYVAGYEGSGIGQTYVKQYIMSTAFDLSTASLLATSSDISTQGYRPYSIYITPDGVHLFHGDINVNRVFRYTMSTPWDITTLSYDGSTYDYYYLAAGSGGVRPYGMSFSSDGLEMYLSDQSDETLYKYDLAVAWDQSSFTLKGTLASVDINTNPNDFWIDPSGLRVYVISGLTDLINQFDIIPSNVPRDAGYVFVGMLRSKSLSITSGSIDVTDVDSNDWKTLDDRGLGDRSMSFAGSGVLNDLDDAQVALEDAVWSGALQDLRITMPNGDAFTGTFKIPTFNRDSSMADVLVFSMSAESAGEVVLTRYTGPVGPVINPACAIGTQSYGFVEVGLEFLADPPMNSSPVGQGLYVDNAMFRDDGLKFYACAYDDSNNAAILQFSLTSPWDLSTMSLETYKDVSAQDLFPNVILFSADGFKMWMWGWNSGSVFQYDLGTAWDVSTAVYNSGVTLYDFGEGVGDYVWGAHFNDDGTQLIINNIDAGRIVVYNLGIAYDLSTTSITASYGSNWVGTGGLNNPAGIDFNMNGTRMYVAEYSSQRMAMYECVTPWQMSDISYLGYVDLYVKGTTGRDEFFFSPDGLRAYSTTGGSSAWYQVDLNVAYDLDSADLTTIATVGVNITPGGDYLRISADGTKVWGISGDNVYQHDLSTPYDLTTWSYSGKSFDMWTTGTTAFRGVIFSTDGTKMIGVSGSPSNPSIGIRQFSLSTPFDVTTATYIGTYTYPWAENIYGFDYKPDGTSISFVGNNSVIRTLTLSTPFDITTASAGASLTLDVANAGLDVPYDYSIQFNADGTKMYIQDGGRVDFVEEFTLSTPYDPSSAAFTGERYVLAWGNASDISQICLSHYCDKFIVVGYSSNGKCDAYEWNITG